MAENKPNKIPIRRLNKFYSEDDFELDKEMGRELIEGDLNFKIALYQVDKKKTNIDDLYGEADPEEVRFKPPVELKVLLNLEESNVDTYSKGRLRFEEYGNLIFHVYVDQLEEKNVEIEHGDIVAYNDLEDNTNYFQVVDPNYIFSSNEKTMFGYKPFYRTVKCTNVGEDEIHLQR